MFVKAIKGLQAYRIWAKAYDVITKWRSNVGTEVVNGVPVKSAWLSKINWTQAVTVVAMILTFFGINVPEETKAALIAGIGSIGAVVTWIFRTWFNKTVTEAPK